jgi:transposase
MSARSRPAAGRSRTAAGPLAKPPMGRPTPAVLLTDDERRTLRRWLRDPAVGPALALHARVVLSCAEGLSNLEVAARLGIHRTTVGTWRSRFMQWRLEGLGNLPRPGAPRTITDEQVRQVIVRTLEWVRKDRAYWSAASLAEQVGMSPSAVSRIWRAFGLQPRLVASWKRSNDPQLINAIRDVVGLYLNPPEAVMVLCRDERSEPPVEASHPVLLLRPGVTPTGTNNGRCPHAARELDAAMEIAAGTVIPQMSPWRRVLEFQRFLRRVDRVVPAVMGVDLILGISSTCAAPTIRRWLLDHPRVRLHFTPTESSWRALVQHWLAELTAPGARQAKDCLTVELARSVRSWIVAGGYRSHPFAWTRTSEEIRERVNG